MSDTFRIEQDSMGELKVPADALYAAQTQRAVENFPVSGLTLPPAFIRAVALIKQCAAEVNAKLGVLEPAIAEAIGRAAEEIVAGHHLEQFPVDVFQTGSGTSTNMNANEVIATLASRGSPGSQSAPTTMSTWGRAAMTRSPRPSTSAPPSNASNLSRAGITGEYDSRRKARPSMMPSRPAAPI